MSIPARRGRRARYLITTAALVGSALAPVSALASAPAGGQPIEAGENLTIVHNIDFIAAFGVGAIGDDVTVEVLRNGVVIGSAAGPLVDTAEGPGLEVNHGPLLAPVDGDCWTGFTPDVIPGDLVRVTHVDSGDVDEALVDHLSFNSAEIEAGTGDVLYKGEARYANNGSPIPAVDLNSGFWRTDVNGQDTRGENPNVVNPDGNWTARWLAPDFGRFKPLPTEPNPGVTAEHVRDATRQEFGYGHVAPLPPETQLADGIGETPGPAPLCEGSPSEGNSVLDADDDTISINSGTLELTGSKMTAADSVVVSLTDGTTTVGPLPVAPGAGANDWVLSVSRAQLDTLAQGEITISGAYDHGGTVIGGRTLSIQKDTVAPDVSPSLAPGTYTGTRSVELSAGGDSILFGTNGIANRVYEGAIDLPVGTTTITAKATDAAGNESVQESYTYTINAPANGGAGAGGAGVGAGAGGTSSPVVVPAVQRFVQVSSLRARSRVRLRSARRSGIRVSFVAPEGANVVRVQLFRGSRAAQADQPLGQATVQLSRTGRHAVRLRSRAVRRALRRGVYRIVISAGQSEDSLNQAVGKRIRIVR